ncbi:MAG: hypothetical protein JKY48_19350 [Flavobacteriales bacterium]|nr:hypothetical protein [Flavobacteriales bacterium]
MDTTTAIQKVLIIKTVFTSVGKVEKFDSDLIVVTYNDNVSINLVEAIEIDMICFDLSNQKNTFLITDVRNIHSNMSNEAQNFFSKKGKLLPYIKGLVILLNNLPIRLIARFYIQFHKPIYPTKIYATKEEAFKWFKSIDKQQIER